jgi:hypothetical protein
MTAVVLLLFVVVAAAWACVVSLCFDAGVEAEPKWKPSQRLCGSSFAGSR